MCFTCLSPLLVYSVGLLHLHIFPGFILFIWILDFCLCVWIYVAVIWTATSSHLFVLVNVKNVSTLLPCLHLALKPLILVSALWLTVTESSSTGACFSTTSHNLNCIFRPGLNYINLAVGNEMSFMEINNKCAVSIIQCLWSSSASENLSNQTSKLLGNPFVPC